MFLTWPEWCFNSTTAFTFLNIGINKVLVFRAVSGVGHGGVTPFQRSFCQQNETFVRKFDFCKAQKLHLLIIIQFELTKNHKN
jgi:hypothetical protein